MPDMVLDDDQMCFCCGTKNPIGLKLEFAPTAEGRLRTIWRPRKEHQGFKDIVHGGLVATVLDEVMVQLLTLRGIPAVTAGMETKLIRPLRWGRAYRFEAWIVSDRGKAEVTEADSLDVESGERVAWGKATCMRVGPHAGFPARGAAR